jgi:NAD-dependent deacetylase
MTLQEFAERLRKRGDVVFFTGAGISTDSGVPDFRSPGGIWTKYSPVYFDEFVSSEAARGRYWKMKRETHALYKNVQPNIGHHSIAAFEKRGQLLGLITQNVDGLHSIAGNSPEKMVELHGTDRKVSCLGCSKEFVPEPIYQRLEQAVLPSPCDACGGLLKPATISFGQPMPQAEMKRAQEWSEAAEVFIVVGSSLVVQPAAAFPVIAKQGGATLAIINREPTPLDALSDYNFRGPIGEFFQELNPLLADG